MNQCLAPGRRAPCCPSFAHSCLPVADPSFQLSTVHDAEHQDHPVLVDHVMHHAVVANTEPVKRVSDALDCLDRLAPDPTRLRSVFGEPFQRSGDPVANLR